MRIKNGVRIRKLCPELLLLLLVAESLRREVYDNKGITITSVSEGKHSRGSLHYDGKAVDIRSRDMAEPAGFVELLKDALGGLGSDYDVVLEKDHIHCEYQPKVQ